MKKFLLTALVMLSMTLVSHAGSIRDIPVGPDRALATADYGGVTYSTNNFPLAGSFSTACINSANFTCRGVFYGVFFSSGNTVDFVDVFDSTSADTGKLQGAIMRLYNVQISSAGTSQFAAGFSGPPKPIRFSEGLITRPSVGGYNSIMTLYNQER